MIYLRKNTVLDCYLKCSQGKCLASKANSPNRLKNIATGIKASANAKLVVRKIHGTRHYKAYLQATKLIPANTEILWRYGSIYTLYKTK
jgi:hypothetical protein